MAVPESELVPGGRIEATPEGYIGHVLYRPGMPPFASYGPYATREEAEREIRAWWEWYAETQRQQQAQQERRAEQRREEFLARVRARRAKARQHFQRSHASVVTLDGIAYQRHEFRSLRHQPRQPRPRRTRPRAFTRTGPRRTRAPASSGDDSSEPPPDLARLAVASTRLWAHVRRREAREKAAA